MSANSPDLHPMSAGDILDHAIRLYRENFVPLVTIVAIVNLPLVILQALGLAFLLPLSTGLESSQNFEPVPNGIGYLVFTLLALLGSVFVLFEIGALVAFVSERFLGRALTVRRAYGNAFRRWLSLLLAALLLGFGIFGMIAVLFGVAFVPLLAAGAFTSGSSSSSGLAGLTVLCFCVLLVPLLLAALYLGVRWAFWVQAIMLENYNSTGGLGRSWKLVKGSFWRVLGFILLLAIFNYFVTLGPATALSVGAIFLPPVIGVAMQTVVSGVIGILIAPITYITMTVLYYDLRIRREGFDLQMRMQEPPNVQEPPLDLPSLIPGSPQ